MTTLDISAILGIVGTLIGIAANIIQATTLDENKYFLLLIIVFIASTLLLVFSLMKKVSDIENVLSIHNFAKSLSRNKIKILSRINVLSFLYFLFVLSSMFMIWRGVNIKIEQFNNDIKSLDFNKSIDELNKKLEYSRSQYSSDLAIISDQLKSLKYLEKRNKEMEEELSKLKNLDDMQKNLAQKIESVSIQSNALKNYIEQVKKDFLGKDRQDLPLNKKEIKRHEKSEEAPKSVKLDTTIDKNNDVLFNTYRISSGESFSIRKGGNCLVGGTTRMSVVSENSDGSVNVNINNVSQNLSSGATVGFKDISDRNCALAYISKRTDKEWDDKVYGDVIKYVFIASCPKQ